MAVKYEEIERFGSWGAASMKRKALVDTYGEGNVFIFKELTKTPFTAFRHDQYVVMLRRVTGLGGKK